MKTKTFRKKLTLNKKTVVNLTGNAMNDVYGGRPNTEDQCVTLDSLCVGGPFYTNCVSDCIDCTNACSNQCTVGCTKEACSQPCNYLTP
jgi:hypothetical protein